MRIEDIAKVAHEANRAYCQTYGDNSQKSWEEAEQWQRDSAVVGVKFRLENPAAAPSSQHDAWLRDKLNAGWKYGPMKDAEKKEHPCIVAYEELPEFQKGKDALFVGVVDSLVRYL